MTDSPPTKRMKLAHNATNMSKEDLNVKNVVYSNGLNSNGVELDESLYSRQIYVMGTEAMKSMSKSKILISGLSGLGVEIAKNIILAGFKTVSLSDNNLVSDHDFSSQYFFKESDIGKTRAQSCLGQLVELNSYVDVNVITEELSEDNLTQYDVVILTNESFDKIAKVSLFCHSNNIKLIVARTLGLSGMIFCDMGPSHVVIDATGEEPLSIMIQKVHNDMDGLVLCLEETRHGFQDGDWVTFSEVGGMDALNNCMPRSIIVEGPASFKVGDLSSFPAHTTGGICTQVKMPKVESYLSFEEAYKNPEFVISDFAKFDRGPQLHILFGAHDMFIEKYKREPFTKSDRDEFVKFVKELEVTISSEVDDKLLESFLATSRGTVAPMCAVIGGIAAQEALKACSGKFSPIKQFFYFDAFECLAADDVSLVEQVQTNPTVLDTSLSNSVEGIKSADLSVQESRVIEQGLTNLIDVSNGTKEADILCRMNADNYQHVSSRYRGQVAIFGEAFQKKLANHRIFVVGAGAIGCELLKNMAMMGVGTSDGAGRIIVTDMDNIERSNLNRQFLFRNSDIGQLKSSTAARAVRAMNPLLNIEALDLKVGRETESFFNDRFFSGVDVVVNALDNVEARQYVDRLCVFYEKPLLESGTLGTKANVQVILPRLTESYSSSQDPPEKSVPVCTLKNFPYLIEHTIQWARELFESTFALPSSSACQFLADKQQFIDAVYKSQSLENVDQVINLLHNVPTSFKDCIVWAKNIWQEHFCINIMQLLHNFPSDSSTTLGLPFWSGTKRCPKALEFNINNSYHFNFVQSAAKIRAFIFNIDSNVDAESVRSMIDNCPVRTFVPKTGVKIATTETEASRMAEANVDVRKLDTMVKKLDLLETIPVAINDVVFEKDHDSNHHMDFITAASNLRAANYSIEPADRLRTKMIAGNIIPAIATTTGLVAGLVSLELYKIVQGHSRLDQYKNGFVNLALPFFGFSEPLAPATKTYGDKTFTLWDKFVLRHPMTLQQLIDYFKDEHNMLVTMLTQDVSMIYAFFQSDKVKQQRLKMTLTDLIEHVSKRPIADHVSSLVLEMSCTDLDGDDLDTPYIRYDLGRQ